MSQGTISAKQPLAVSISFCAICISIQVLLTSVYFGKTQIPSRKKRQRCWQCEIYSSWAPTQPIFLESDDSGKGPRPHSKSNVKKENRIWFNTRDTAATYLSGPHLTSLASRFQHGVRSRVGALSPTSSWMECDHGPLVISIRYYVSYPNGDFVRHILFGTEPRLCYQLQGIL